MIERRNMAKDVKHFQNEILNCMYQLSDGELLEVLTDHPMETERLRATLREIEVNENQEDEENHADQT
jgi:TusA-related sulfurtransferase